MALKTFLETEMTVVYVTQGHEHDIVQQTILLVFCMNKKKNLIKLHSRGRQNLKIKGQVKCVDFHSRV